MQSYFYKRCSKTFICAHTHTDTHSHAHAHTHTREVYPTVQPPRDTPWIMLMRYCKSQALWFEKYLMKKYIIMVF